MNIHSYTLNLMFNDCIFDFFYLKQSAGTTVALLKLIYCLEPLVRRAMRPKTLFLSMIFLLFQVFIR